MKACCYVLRVFTKEPLSELDRTCLAEACENVTGLPVVVRTDRFTEAHVDTDEYMSEEDAEMLR